MLKETSVVAVAGIRRLFIGTWALFCFLIALICFLVGILKFLGLVGAMAMLTVDGMVASENASRNATVHIIFMTIFFCLGLLFWRWFSLAKRTLSMPFENEIRKAEILINDFEVGARVNSKSIRDTNLASRHGVEEAEQNSAFQHEQVERSHAYLNGYDKDGLTPLMRAVREVNLEKVKSLLSQGADPVIKDDRFGTSTASDYAIRALRISPTEKERMQLQQIIEALDDAARST